MIEADAIVKKWGNSFGIVLPKLIAKKNKLSPNDKVHILITKVDKKNVVNRLWGALPQWKTPSEELEKFVDKEFDLPV